MERQAGHGSEGFDHHGTDGEGRDEVGVHHVDVDEVGMGLHQLYLVGEVREVRREDRGGQLAHDAGL
jgi:hypothetical protein